MILVVFYFVLSELIFWRNERFFLVVKCVDFICTVLDVFKDWCVNDEIEIVEIN